MIDKVKHLGYLFFIEPFKNRGFFWGTLDVGLKVFALAVWLFVMRIIMTLLYDAVVLEYNPKTRIWWYAYCTVVFLGASLFAYIAIFVRRERR